MTRTGGWAAPALWPIGLGAVVLLTLGYGPGLGARPMLIAASALALGSLAALWWQVRRVNAGTVVASFYVAFHFGLVAPVALGADAPVLAPEDRAWANAQQLALPGLIAAIFIGIFVVAYLAGSVTKRPRHHEGSQVFEEHDAVGNYTNRASGTALIALFAGLGLWSSIFVSAGVGVIGSYGVFLEATRGSATPYAYLLISLGMGTLGACSSSGARQVGTWCFLLWAIPAFLIGLRGEVIIPALAYAVARSRSGQVRMRPRLLVAGALSALSLGSLVRVVRVGGDASLATLNPLSGVAELGYSIRPMVMVVQAQSSFQQSLVGFDTYTAPFERLLFARLLGYPSLPVASDMDVFGTFIASTYGPIGGSISAEALRAAGLLGVAVVAGIVGLLCARIDISKPSTISNAVAGMFSAVLLLWVRNDFTSMGVSLLAIIGLAAWMRPARRVKSSSPSKVKGRPVGTRALSTASREHDGD